MHLDIKGVLTLGMVAVNRARVRLSPLPTPPLACTHIGFQHSCRSTLTSLWYDGFRINRKSGALAERNGVHRSGYFVDSNFESFGPRLSTALSQPVAKQVYRFCGTKIFTQSRCSYEEVCKVPAEVQHGLCSFDYRLQFPYIGKKT